MSLGRKCQKNKKIAINSYSVMGKKELDGRT